MTVLQYADAFESFLAQIDDYDEAQYLVHFIFGLRPEIMRLVYMQQPASLLAAKNMAEKLELTHLATSEPYPRTKKQKTSKTQHRGTQERRSGGHNQQKDLPNQYRDRGRGGLQNQHSTEAAYPLVQEHLWRRAVRKSMDRQLCGDP